jgi:surfeit locus 1 family protein
MHRATAKQQLLNQFAQRSRQSPQPLADYEPVYTPVQVTGSYDSEHPILLDNRIVNHQAGYEVLVPFIPTGSSKAVLINLGWTPRDLSALKNMLRKQEVTVVGLVQAPQHNLVLAHPKTELHWPLLVEEVRLDNLSRILNRPLYPFILLLDKSKVGFTPQIDVGISPARHRGYAVQWFLLALTLLFLYFKLNISRQNDE